MLENALLMSQIMPLFIVVVFIIVYLVKKKQYEKTEYYMQTGNSYFRMWSDKGRLGEFYTYQYLKPLKGYKRYLFNCYLPKPNGETTEVDVILLHESGIYVFESKNYGGWIFGTETQQYWTQTLPAGKGKTRKNRFFNPIKQNEVHLKWLQAFLGKNNLKFYSYIVFSDRCTLKDIKLISSNHYVINRYNLLASVSKNAAKAKNRLSPEQIDALYEQLYPLTQTDEEQKKIHIKNIQNKY